MRRISNLSNRGGWAKEAVLAKSTGLELHALIFFLFNLPTRLLFSCWVRIHVGGTVSNLYNMWSAVALASVFPSQDTLIIDATKL